MRCLYIMFLISNNFIYRFKRGGSLFLPVKTLSNPAPDTTYLTDKFITFVTHVNSVETNERW